MVQRVYGEVERYVAAGLERDWNGKREQGRQSPGQLHPKSQDTEERIFDYIGLPESLAALRPVVLPRKRS